MPFVAPKTKAQQTVSALHRVRELLVCDRTRTSNQIHALLLDIGISLPIGFAVIRRLPTILNEQALPPLLVHMLLRLHAHFRYLDEQIADTKKRIDEAIG